MTTKIEATTDAPTLASNAALERRVRKMEKEHDVLKMKEEELQSKITTGLAEGRDVTALTTQRRDVREQRDDLLEALPIVRQKLTDDRYAVALDEAKQRHTGIKRAYGSLVSQLDKDEAAVVEACRVVRDAIVTVNARYTTLMKLPGEADALSDRFGLLLPALPPVIAPDRRDVVAAVIRLQDVAFVRNGRTRPRTEKDETGMVERRTYAEVAGTDAYTIIASVGPKDFPALTDRQRTIVASRERQDKAFAREMAEATYEIEGRERALDGIAYEELVTALLGEPECTLTRDQLRQKSLEQLRALAREIQKQAQAAQRRQAAEHLQQAADTT